MARMNNVDLIKLGADFSERAYGKRTDPLPSDWEVLRPINNPATGYQAMVYVNRTTHEIFYANTGTNDGLFGQDAQGWKDAVFGPKSPQFNDMLFESSLINNRVKPSGDLAGYTVYTTGHSWGELMGQAQTYTFGWTGVGFDGPGAGLVVSDSRFSTMLQAQNIAAVGGTDFITVDTTGFGPMGGAFIGNLGADISGTTQFNVTLPGSLQSGAFNIYTTAAGGVVAGVPGIVVGGIGGKVYTGVALHPMSGINQAIQAGQFEPVTGVNPDGWWLTEASSGVYFSDNKYRYDNSAAGVYVEWGSSGAQWLYPDGNGGSINVHQFADGVAWWSRLDALGNTIESLEVDPITGTVSHVQPGPRVHWQQINDLATGSLIGEVDKAGAPATPTSALLSTLLDSIRSSAAFEDQSLISASEVRALTGTQAAGETFGGTRLLEFSGDALSDYWNFTNSSSFSGTYFNYDESEDYNFAPGDTSFSLGNSSPLLSMDYSGLGFLPSFGLGGSTNALLSYDYSSFGNTTTTSFNPDSWVYTSQWYDINNIPAYNYSAIAAPSIDPYSLPSSSAFSSLGSGNRGSGYVYYNSPSSYAEVYFWPIALDLDGDGVELVSEQDSRAYYDVKGDGFRRNIGWIGADDAFLAIDKDGNGKIEQADELSFALWTATPDDTDLDALKAVFDTNHDNKIDASDAQFSQLRVWQDANGDGITDAGELKTLAQRGITAINLTAAQTDWSSGGNHISGFTSYSKTDGSNGWAADVGLGYEADGWKATVQGNLVKMTQSGGLVYGLAQSGALNLDLGVQGLNGAFGGTGADTLTAGSVAGALLNGGDGNDTLTGGAGDDWLSGGLGSDVFNGGAGDDTLLIDAADLQANINGGDGFDIAVVTGTAGVTLDLFHTKLEAAIGGDGNDRFNTTGTGRTVLAGQGGDDILKSGAGHDVLQGGTGNDILYGGLGTDTAIYTGNQADYEFVANLNGSVTVRDINTANGDDGSDTLYGIQTIRFADGDISLSPSNTGKGEFRVNTTTVRDQFFPSVAALADGGYVVAWMDDTATATDANIYAQRYGADGNATGAEFRVNTYTTSQQEIPSVTGLTDGGYVVVWRSNGQDGSSRGIYAQRYSAGGSAVGGEFRVNTYTADIQDDPTVVSMADGGYLVTWQSNLQDGSGYGVYAQRYTASGSAFGTEFRVNTTTASHQNNPEVTLLTDGGYVVTWSSGATPSTSNIYAQRYAADGSKVAGEIKVNTTVYGAESSVTALADGGYVVAWLAITGGSRWDVFAQRYTAAGTAVGGELMLSTSSTGSSSTSYNSLQVAPVVTALIDGSYVVTWTVYSATGADLYLRRAVDGNAIGDVIRVNTTTANNQSTPAVTAMPDGGFVVTWTSVGAGANEDTFAQRYDADGRPWTADLTLTGTAEADFLNSGSSAAAVTLIGLAGDDVYVIGAGDTVTEGVNAGIDTVQSSITYTLGANLENLTLTGTTAINGTGNALNNTLVGNGAVNVLAGGAGDDIYVIGTGDTVIENASEGTDTIQTSVTNVLAANVENLILTGSSAIDGTGNGLNNTLTGNSANNVLNGGGGADSLAGGSGDDTYIVDNVSDAVVEGENAGTDSVQTSVTYTLANNVENLTLTGTTAINGTGNALDNVLIGNSAANQLNGGSGNDTLDGGTGNDVLQGDNGADTYLFGIGSGQDVINNADSEAVGVNLDTLQFGAGIATTGVTITRTNDDLIVGLVGQTDTVRVTNYFLNDGTSANVVENLRFADGTIWGYTTVKAKLPVSGVTLNGTAGNDSLTGGTGNDTLNGLAGNDTLNGGAGADTMNGGAGNDTYVIDNTGDIVTELANEGTDTVQSGIAYTLGTNVENLTLTGTAAINGTGNTSDNVLTGNAANNTLNGGAGNDTLNGAGGADTLVGGLGNDIYIIDNTGDIVTELANEGTDTVQSGIAYTLGANVENLTLTGTTAINGTGNALNNVLTGNSANNILDGGSGADNMAGGTGNDTYVVDNLGDTVSETSTLATELDTVQSSVVFNLGANLENLILTGTSSINGTGNALNNLIIGNGANNILDGGLGADTMSGGAGNDVYMVDNINDVVSEAAGSGTDDVYSSVTFTLGSNFENLYLTGAAAINGTGNELNNFISGNSAANVLTGGTGNDTYWVGAGDTVVENTNEGMDSVNSDVSYILGANIEGLYLWGSAAISGTGNALNNTIVGYLNAAANTLRGGAGNDTYYVGAGDVVGENANEGIDSVNSYASFSLGVNVENLALMGTGAINGTGNEQNNVLMGNSGNNVLNGGSGNDTLVDNLGNDTFVLGRGWGTDTVIDSDSTAGNTDIAQFLSGVSTQQIWFQHIGNNLEASIIGTSDKLVIQNWYSGAANHVEQFKTTDGAKTLLDSNVENLVNAMASFAPPAAGQTTLPQNYQNALAGVIAANWQ